LSGAEEPPVHETTGEGGGHFAGTQETDFQRIGHGQDVTGRARLKKDK
jgi:hypothetical protein